jgi:hypothetical protein
MVIDLLKGTERINPIFIQDERIRFTRDDSNNTIIIKETQQDAKLKKVSICDFSENTIGIKMDAFGKNICNFFNHSKENINKGSDALLYTKCIGSLYDNSEFFNRKFILIIDLKSNEPKGFDLQMRSTRAFTQYVKAVLTEFHPQNDINEYKIICVLFSSERKIKTYTQRKNHKYGRIDNINGVKYLNCYATGEKYTFHLKKIIEDFCV